MLHVNIYGRYGLISYVAPYFNQMNSQIYVGLPEQVQFYSKNNIKATDVLEIIKLTCNALKISEEKLMSRCRKRPLVEARQIAIYLMYQANRKLTLVGIGRVFKMDHSTIIYALKKYDDLFETSRDFRDKVASVKKLTHYV